MEPQTRYEKSDQRPARVMVSAAVFSGQGAPHAGVLMRRLIVLVVAVAVGGVMVRGLWYAAVVIGVPLVPARDDQGAREAIVRSIQEGELPYGTDGAGHEIVSLPIGSADLASGGIVTIFEDQPLVLAFINHNGIGRFDGWVFVSTGSSGDIVADGRVARADPIAPDWFYVYTD